MARNRQIDLMQSGLVPILVLNLAITFLLSASISLGAHIGGLIGGADRDVRRRGARARRRGSTDRRRIVACVRDRRRRAVAALGWSLAVQSVTVCTPPGGSGTQVRVQRVAEPLQAVDQARAGAREPGGGVGHDDLLRRRAPASSSRVGVRLLEAALDVVAARRDDHDLRPAPPRPPPTCAARTARPAGRAGPRRRRTRSAAAPSGRRRRPGPATRAAATRTRAAPRVATRTRSIRAAASCTRSTPASLRSVAWASVRTSPSTSPSVCGSSETISGTGSIRSAIARTSSAETAQTLHSACVTIRSGCRRAQARLVELVDRAALLGQRLAPRGRSRPAPSPGPITSRVTLGRFSASAG